jgi:hypothetical protein
MHTHHFRLAYASSSIKLFILSVTALYWFMHGITSFARPLANIFPRTVGHANYAIHPVDPGPSLVFSFVLDAARKFAWCRRRWSREPMPKVAISCHSAEWVFPAFDEYARSVVSEILSRTWHSDLTTTTAIIPRYRFRRRPLASYRS